MNVVLISFSEFKTIGRCKGDYATIGVIFILKNTNHD